MFSTSSNSKISRKEKMYSSSNTHKQIVLLRKEIARAKKEILSVLREIRENNARFLKKNLDFWKRYKPNLVKNLR